MSSDKLVGNMSLDLENSLSDSMISITESPEADEENFKLFILNAHKEDSLPIYNRFQIPPNLEIAQRHWHCSGIGNIIKEPGEIQEEQSICPCCLKPKRSNFSFFKKSTSDVDCSGSAIPLFFQYSKFILVFMLLFAFHNAYFTYKMAMLQCDYQKKTTGTCVFKMQLFMGYTNQFWEAYESEIDGLWKDWFLFTMLCSLLTVCFSVYSLIAQFRYIKRLQLLRNMSAKDFTVMVEGLGYGDNEDTVVKWINQELSLRSLPEITAVKSNIAQPKVRKFSSSKKIFIIEEKVRALSEFKNNIQTTTFKERAKIQKEFIRLMKKRRELTITKLNQERLLNNDVDSQKSTSVMFLTLDNQREVQRVLSMNLVRNPLMRCISSQKRFEIREAGDPSQIVWDSIGFNFWTKVKPIFLAIVISILFYFFMYFGLIFLQTLKFEVIQEKIDENKIILLFRNCGPTLFTIFCIKTLNTILAELSEVEIFIRTGRFYEWKAIRILAAKVVAVLLSIITATIISIDDSPNDFQLKMFRICQTSFYYSLTQCYAEPLLTYINLKYIYRSLKRWKVIRNIGAISTVNQKELSYDHFMTQEELQNLFTKPDSNIPGKLTNLAGVLFNIALYQHYVPVVAFVGTLSVFMQICVDKHLFFTRYKAPTESVENVVVMMQRIVITFIPAMYFIGNVLSVYLRLWGRSDFKELPFGYTINILLFLLFLVNLVPKVWLARYIINKFELDYRSTSPEGK